MISLFKFRNAYVKKEKQSWDSQTLFSSRPAAFEPPSAVFNLNWQTVFELRKKGVQVVNLTHACGISSTGEAELDRQLPFKERYDIPTKTAGIINQVLRSGGRVVAFGTSVVRALESAYDTSSKKVRSGSHLTSLIVDKNFSRRVVKGILTGLHEDGASHLKMIQSFIPKSWIENGYSEGVRWGYQGHEHGDSCLIL